MPKTIELTEAQTEVVEWVLGGSFEDRFYESDTAGSPGSFVEKEQPELDERRLVVYDDVEVIQELLYRTEEFFTDIADDNPDLSPQGRTGKKRAAQNLGQKLRDAFPGTADEIDRRKAAAARKRREINGDWTPETAGEA